MSYLQSACKTLGAFLVCVLIPCAVFGQITNYYVPQAGEYYPLGSLPGDQDNSALAVSTNGGYVVWQDQISDQNGLGLSFVSLDATFSPATAPQVVNTIIAGDQENPQVALLKGGGAVFVWQGGQQGFQHIYARFLNVKSGGGYTFGTNVDLMVNANTNYFQQDPALTVLANSNVLVTWASWGEDNLDGFQGVYAQLLSPTGQKIGTEFLVNKFTPWNQRSPSVASFANGNFIITWVSEQETASTSVGSTGVTVGTYNSVDIYARLFNSTGTALGNEFRVNTSTNTCANPVIAVASDNSYTFAWSELNITNTVNGWDIVSRPYSASGVGGSSQYVNSQKYYNQYQPRIAAAGTDFMVVWTSDNQDGSREGVYSQFLRSDGTLEGVETKINTTVLNSQKFPAVASDGVGRFIVTWSSYMGFPAGMDLAAQRYSTTLQPLAAPSTPSVFSLENYNFSVTWPPVAGFNVSSYQLYIDGTPLSVGTNHWSNATNYNYFFGPYTTHTFQLSYILVDGRISPLSGISTNTTSGPTDYAVGLPVDWEIKYYGTNSANWVSTTTILAPGVTVGMVYGWGANPKDSTTWLKQSITHNSQGVYLNWNTIPGGIYQVLTSTSASGPWTNYGTARFAASSSDSIFLGTTGQGFFQIVRNRY